MSCCFILAIDPDVLWVNLIGFNASCQLQLKEGGVTFWAANYQKALLQLFLCFLCWICYKILSVESSLCQRICIICGHEWMLLMNIFVWEMILFCPRLLTSKCDRSERRLPDQSLPLFHITEHKMWLKGRKKQTTMTSLRFSVAKRKDVLHMVQ